MERLIRAAAPGFDSLRMDIPRRSSCQARVSANHNFNTVQDLFRIRAKAVAIQGKPGSYIEAFSKGELRARCVRASRRVAGIRGRGDSRKTVRPRDRALSCRHERIGLPPRRITREARSMKKTKWALLALLALAFLAGFHFGRTGVQTVHAQDMQEYFVSPSWGSPSGIQ